MKKDPNGKYNFNEEEKKSLEKGLADIKAGRVYSQEDAKKMVSAWIQEKSKGKKNSDGFKCLADKASDEMDRLWDKNGWDNETMKNWENEHL